MSSMTMQEACAILDQHYGEDYSWRLQKLLMSQAFLRDLELSRESLGCCSDEQAFHAAHDLMIKKYDGDYSKIHDVVRPELVAVAWLIIEQRKDS